MEQQKLPNTGIILWLGIASILLCWCYGVLGLILSIVAIVLASKSKNIFNENPEDYSDYSTVKTGKIIAIVGLILNLIFLLGVIWLFSAIDMEALQSGDEELIKESIEELFS